MKLHRIALPLALLSALVLPNSALRAQQASPYPGDIASLVGGQGFSTILGTHISLGLLYRSDVSTYEKLNLAYKQSGLLLGGTQSTIKKLEASLDDWIGDDVRAIKQILEVTESLHVQVEALRTYLLAVNEDKGVEAARRDFEEKREKSKDLALELFEYGADMEPLFR